MLILCKQKMCGETSPQFSLQDCSSATFRCRDRRRALDSMGAFTGDRKLCRCSENFVVAWFRYCGFWLYVVIIWDWFSKIEIGKLESLQKIEEAVRIVYNRNGCTWINNFISRSGLLAITDWNCICCLKFLFQLIKGYTTSTHLTFSRMQQVTIPGTDTP